MTRSIVRLVSGLLLLLALVSSLRAQLLGWKKKTDGPALGNPLTYNPLNHRTIYGSGVKNGEGIVVVSYDRGTSWKELSVVSGGGRIKSIALRPIDSLSMLIGQEGMLTDRIMKSTDGGSTWAQTLSGDFSYFGVPVECGEAHPDTVFTMMGSKLYTSTDFGSTWTVVNVSTGFNAWCDAALRPDSVGVMYVGDNSGGIWKTENGGLTFRLMHKTTGEIPMIAIDQHNPSIAYATKYGGGGGLLKTTDYGESWSPVLFFNGIPCWGVGLGVDQSGLMLVGTYTDPHGSYISHDNGNTWQIVTCGLSSLLNYGVLVMDSAAMTILQEDGIYSLQRIDLSRQPTSTIKGTVEDSAKHSPIDAEVTLSYSRCDSSKTQTVHTDAAGGFSFTGLYTSDPPLLSPYVLEFSSSLPYGHLAVEPIHLDTSAHMATYSPRTADVLLTGSDSGGMYRYYATALDSLGISWNFWNTLSQGTPPYRRCPELGKNAAIYFSEDATDPVDSATLDGLTAAALGGTGLFLTGQNIVERHEAEDLFAQVLQVGFQANTSSSYVAGNNGDIMEGVACLTSGGTGAGNQNSRDILRPLSSGTVPVMNYIGIADTAIAAVRVAGRNGSGRSVVLGFGFEAISLLEERRELMRRVIGYLDGSIVAGAEEEGGTNSTPRATALVQNYPNPFNPTTNIRLRIADRGCVSLKIFDIMGREVATLADGVRDPGAYTFAWDAGGMPSGIYFYRLVTPSRVEAKKMSLIK